VPTALLAAETESTRRTNEIEGYLPGHPKRALAEIARSSPAPTTIRRPTAIAGSSRARR
jgi:hypothetical protein